MSQDYDVDVIQMSDFRLPGGTTSSIAEEVRAQSAAGLSTAVVHVAGAVTNYPLGWSAHIRRILDLPGVRLCTPHTRLRAKVLVIRHPTVLLSTRISLERLEADHIIIVANHAAIDAAGTQHYDMAATDAKARAAFGKAPIWSPIGPVVRGTMLEQTQEIPLRDTDWFNIFDFPEAFEQRTGFVEDRPVIGRHSRPQRGKWPDTSEDILAAYPNSPEYAVRILGGAQIAQRLIGHVPESWEVIPFGGEDPTKFLRRIDFWVYMHHPDLKEAFGRAAMESLAAGCVAIMPPYMEELFGDAALYAEPRDVQALVDEYRAEKEKFLAQSRRAQDFAHSFSPQMHVDRLAELGAVPTHGTDVDPAPRNDRSADTTHRAVGPTLLVTVGPQSEKTQLALAGGSNNDDLIWVSVGDDTQTVPDQNVSLFVSSARRLNMDDEAWNDYFVARLDNLLAGLRPDRVIYSGVLPPQALEDCLAGAPVEKVWMQQPIDNPEVGEKAIKSALNFHTVIDTDAPVNEFLQGENH
ncbi:MAG: glycosyltransferase [Brevibacterium aurantiacum]|uniref:glycosyltransferase n=1 Tax=Brevibacterium aurantiacum TaxID=273384 RepID=UPI003F915E73